MYEVTHASVQFYPLRLQFAYISTQNPIFGSQPPPPPKKTENIFQEELAQALK